MTAKKVLPQPPLADAMVMTVPLALLPLPFALLAARRPWEMRMPLYRRIEPNARPLEYDCYAFKDVFRLP